MKQVIIALFLLISFTSVLAQSNGIYIVNTGKLNLRSGPGSTYDVIGALKQGDNVTVIKREKQDWWYVEFGGLKGFVSADFLKLDPYGDWEKMDYQTGDTPEYESFEPEVDIRMDNYLKVNVGNTDVIVKLMKIGSLGDKCIRVAYVRSGDSFSIKHIPQGQYYLKLAYGKDYRQKIVNGEPYMKFLKNALYEKGDRILDFNLVKKPTTTEGDTVYENWDIPSFELKLDVVTTTDRDNFDTNGISEAEFND